MKRLDIYDYHLDPCVQSRFEEIWTGCWGFPCGSSGKETTCHVGHRRDLGWIPGSGRPPAGGHGNPLAWKILCTEKPGGLQYIGSPKV